jgi:methanethiol S-methyltransferase
MSMVSIFYAALGYLSLLAALLWGVFFLGDGSFAPNMDYGTARAFPATFTDLGLLALLAFLHRSIGRVLLSQPRRLIPRGLERSTGAWAAALVLAIMYLAWRPLPEILWNMSGWMQVALSALFYLAWALIFIGVFLTNHLDLFEIGHRSEPSKLPDSLRQPMYLGALLILWATPVMTVGHLLLAGSGTVYLLFDGLLLRAGRASNDLVLEGRPPT